MSRTKNGKLTGKAASLELSDARNELFEAEEKRRADFTARWNKAIDTLTKRMGEAEFDRWYDSYPETMTKAEFLPFIENEIEFFATLESVSYMLDGVGDALNKSYEHDIKGEHAVDEAYRMDKEAQKKSHKQYIMDMLAISPTETFFILEAERL